MLSSWGIAFQAIDVEAEPAARADLARLGIPGVPAVVVGDRAVHGWNPKGAAELVGVAYREPPRLPPTELARRLDRILAAAERAIRQVPDEHLDMTHPGRNRSVRQLGYHIFRLSLAFRDAMAERRLPEAWLKDEAPADLADGAAIARYGGTVRARLTEWLAQPGAWDGVVATYYGPQTGHELLERTAWHAAQHLRQLYAFLARMGVTPEAPLTDADLEGLPLPAEVW
ncbi:MAG: DinB family protein [Candidatus Rokubacteria bacterium]|nr:DinB family protein [Candidatus Rokubacteria bacterium]